MTRPNWNAIKREYAAGELSIRAIAERYGVSDTAIRKTAKKDGWSKPDKVRKTGSHTSAANQSANLRTGHQKTDANTAGFQPDNTVLPDSAQNGETGFDLRNYGLNDMQVRFVEEYLIDLNRSAAYKRAGYKGEGNTAYVNSTRLLRNANVSRAIRAALDLRAQRTAITQDSVLQWWWDIATADATQLTEHHRACCRYCWGFGHNYQWRDAVEFEERSAEARAKKGREPNDAGGYGFDATMDPNPDCPRCNGAGLSRTVFHDTRDLTGSARRLFSGVKEGKFGLEVITRNQDEAMKLVAQHLGMLKNKTELSGPDGGPVQTETINLTPQEAADVYKKMMG